MGKSGAIIGKLKKYGGLGIGVRYTFASGTPASATTCFGDICSPGYILACFGY